MLEPGKGRSKGGQAAAIKRVTLNLKTVEKLVDRIESLVGIFVDPSVSDGERKRARVEFGARRERVATLLSECRFRRAVFKRFESEFTQQALEAQSKKFSSEQHLANFWESQSDLSDRLRQVKMHSDTYEQAREKLVSYNLRLALKLAGERANDHIPFDDLFQSGITGLCEAIDLFEPDRGLKLSTYATYWIMQKMQLCERDLRDLIYRNAYTEALCSSVSSFIGDFVDANGCEPSVKQIASGLRMKEELVLSIQGILTPTVSIDASRTRAKGEDRPSSKIISAAELDLPHEVDRGIEVERLREALVSLPYRQRICIEPRHNLMSSEEKEKLMQYYGVSIDVDPSFGEIGKLFKVTNQRIKQVYGQGLANLLSKLHGIPWVSEGEVKDVIERFNSLSRDMQPTRKSYPI
jgi:RNA polymerase sigma factor (sigma-70 family)